MMVSPIAATISVAAGGANPAISPQAAAAARSAVPDTNRVVQAANNQAERRRNKVEDTKDKRRGVDGEKKSEAAFTPVGVKAKSRNAPNEEEKEEQDAGSEGPDKVDRVDVIA